MPGLWPNLQMSRRFAIAGGLLLPALETIRRWDEIPGPLITWSSWLDDYVIGVLLLLAAWSSRGGGTTGRAALAAAWGFAIGIGLLSLVGSIESWLEPAGSTDPSGLGHGCIVLIKAILVSAAILGAIGAIRPPAGDRA